MSYFIREEPSNKKRYKYVFGEYALFSPLKTDYPFSEVLKDFSNFYNLPYSERLEIAEKYNISTFYIFLDKEKELIFTVDFAKKDRENDLRDDINGRLREVLKCPPKDIFDFEPKDEHEKRNFEKYQKKYFEEDEEIIFFEWFLKKYITKYIDFEQYLIDYWNQMSIDNFPEEYLFKTLSEIKNKVENGLHNHRTEESRRFFLFGVEKFKRGANIPFNGYISELNCFWGIDDKPAYFNESLEYLVGGYETAKFYKFLIEQQKRLLKGEDITKPFEEEEKEKQNTELCEIIEDLKKIPSLSKGIKPYIALFTYYLNESNKIRPRLRYEQDVIDYSHNVLKLKGLSFKNLYSRMKNEEKRNHQIDLLKKSEKGSELVQKYSKILQYG